MRVNQPLFSAGYGKEEPQYAAPPWLRFPLADYAALTSGVSVPR